MKKKRPSHCQLSKKRKRSATGIKEGMDRFFVGGEWKIAGFMHIKPPRWTNEYYNMGVTDLVRRIQDDLEELLARAYPTYTEESEQRFAPNHLRQFPIITYEGRLRCGINKSIAEELCRDLFERISSEDKTVSSKGREEYQCGLQQFLEDEPRHASNALAFVAQQAAIYLEHLSVKRSVLMRRVAAKYNLWPVNLGLAVKIVKGKPRREITRLSLARNYLTRLELNSQCDFPTKHGTSADSPFRFAAKELHTKMLLLKYDPDRHVWFYKVTSWARRLFALKIPMTKRNSAVWWDVAKVYLYERWDIAKEEFKPLINHVGFKYPIELSSKTPYESIIKTRVIDNGLKEAFIALARPDL